ncbi:MAG: Fic/DOC family N-terminal domain-containing protein, partial [Planctomycetaceae bacterium]
MPRCTGTYRQQTAGGETVRAFIPHPLPPVNPPLVIEGELLDRHVAATIALERLSVATLTVPSQTWFLYGFVRKEAVVSSQIEGIVVGTGIRVIEGDGAQGQRAAGRDFSSRGADTHRAAGQGGRTAHRKCAAGLAQCAARHHQRADRLCAASDIER